jgi:hypothetical protein
MSLSTTLLNTLQQDFETPRLLLPQVIQSLYSQHQVVPEKLSAFFAEVFPTLEEYQVELLFAPQFTPSPQDKARYAAILGAAGLSPQEFALLKQTLLRAGIRVSFNLVEAETCLLVNLHEVFVDRYLDRLDLCATLSTPIAEALEQLFSVPDERATAFMTCRSAVWKTTVNQQLLQALFTHATAGCNASSSLTALSLEQLLFLTDVVKTYRPTTLEQLATQLDSLAESCRRDMETVGTRGFHDEYLQSLHANTATLSPTNQDIWAKYRQTISSASQLRQWLPVPVGGDC